MYTGDGCDDGDSSDDDFVRTDRDAIDKVPLRMLDAHCCVPRSECSDPYCHTRQRMHDMICLFPY